MYKNVLKMIKKYQGNNMYESRLNLANHLQK